MKKHFPFKMIRSSFILLICFLFAHRSRCSLYSNAETSPVTELTLATFQDTVISSPEPFLVHFFYPYSLNSKLTAPEFDKAAMSLSKTTKGFLSFAAVDLSKYPEIGRKYGTTSNGEKEGIRFFGIRKESPLEYTGEALAKDILAFGMDNAKTLAFYRVGIVRESPRTNQRNFNKGATLNENQKINWKDSLVRTLKTKDFKELIIDGLRNKNEGGENAVKRPWLVEFYAEWCIHCQNLFPHYEKLASSALAQSVNIAKVHCDEKEPICYQQEISSFPTIRFFSEEWPNGVDYIGLNEFTEISEWVKEKKKESSRARGVRQLTGSRIWKEECENQGEDGFGVVCLLVFLPREGENGEGWEMEREAYLRMIRDVELMHKGEPIAFLWAQGGDFLDLEEDMHLHVGYPSVIALSLAKQKYAIMKGVVAADDLADFVTRVLNGKEALYELGPLPELQEVIPWVWREEFREARFNLDDFDQKEDL